MFMPIFDVINFWVLYILMASSFCMYNCTLYIMPEFTPTKKMLEMHANKGKEDWEIYAECVREAMAKTGNFKLQDQKIREKLEYEKFLYFSQDEVRINDHVVY